MATAAKSAAGSREMREAALREALVKNKKFNKMENLVLPLEPNFRLVHGSFRQKRDFHNRRNYQFLPLHFIKFVPCETLLQGIFSYLFYPKFLVYQNIFLISKRSSYRLKIRSAENPRLREKIIFIPLVGEAYTSYRELDSQILNSRKGYLVRAGNENICAG